MPIRMQRDNNSNPVYSTVPQQYRLLYIDGKALPNTTKRNESGTGVMGLLPARLHGKIVFTGMLQIPREGMTLLGLVTAVKEHRSWWGSITYTVIVKLAGSNAPIVIEHKKNEPGIAYRQ